jgi:predicted DNA-binding protein with PD1-like motif
MRSKLLNVDPPVTYAVVLEMGDEAMGKLAEFIRKNEVEAASLRRSARFAVPCSDILTRRPRNTGG